MLDILPQVNEWLCQKRQVVLATVVNTWGSAPRRIGAKMAVSQDMAMIGSVSGGCVEGAVIEEALLTLEDHQPRLLHYGVSDDDAWGVGLACGGNISIWLELLDPAWWHLAANAAQHDQPLTTLTVVEGNNMGAKIALDARSELVYTSGQLSSEQVRELIDTPFPTQTGCATFASREMMVDVIGSRPHLIMIGGVHIAMVLQRFAKTLGFRTTLIDPRDAFATVERFPDVDCIYHTYPDKVLPQIGIDDRTYIAVLTHDPKIDDRALKTALAAAPAYIGILSSKRTHEKRIERLTEAGIAASDLARLHTPIGLAIGASTPEEIALAVMTEIVSIKNKKH